MSHRPFGSPRVGIERLERATCDVCNWQGPVRLVGFGTEQPARPAAALGDYERHIGTLGHLRAMVRHYERNGDARKAYGARERLREAQSRSPLAVLLVEGSE